MIGRSFEVTLCLALMMTRIASWAEPGTLPPASNIEPETRLLQGHSGQILTLVFAPDGRLLASGGTDQTVRLWEPATGRERKILRGHSGSVLGLAFAANGQWLGSAPGDPNLSLGGLVGCASSGTSPIRASTVSYVVRGKRCTKPEPTDVKLSVAWTAAIVK